MKRSAPWSNTSVSCRLEWRPSRLLIAALIVLGVLAVFSVWHSALPKGLAWLATAVVVLWTVRCVRTHWRQPMRMVWFPGTEAAVQVDGVAVTNVQVDWRGPLAFMQWRGQEGRVSRLVWWPDTLPASRRRELRLAAATSTTTRARPVMAP